MEKKYANHDDYLILKSFAESTARELNYNETFYDTTRQAHFPQFRTEVYIPNNDKELSFYVSLYDKIHRIDQLSLFSGIFIPTSFEESINFKLRKKNFVDRLIGIFNSHRPKTNNRVFDAQVLVITEDQSIIKLLKDRSIQHTITKIFEANPLLQISLHEIKLDFVPQLKDKACIGIFTTQTWLLDKNIINMLFDLAEELAGHINEKN